MSKSTAANICAYSYPPFLFWINTPPIGGPVNTAKLTTVNTIPILTPAFPKSVVRLLSVAGNSPWIPAANVPYMTDHAYREPLDDTAIQQKQRRLSMIAMGTSVLSGPKTRSAR
ncbi:hypothetical protein NHQ30_007825 [Ciborinia camelliae]|nr:hypothetical protein NHQ30_007825 [Ciborinia camelliae]